MAQLKQLLDPDSTTVLEAVRYMSDDPDVVGGMTRTQLYLHMDIRERMLKAQHGANWREYWDAEFADKRELWAAHRDYHEAVKAVRRTR